jgi:hypothetical protein
LDAKRLYQDSVCDSARLEIMKPHLVEDADCCLGILVSDAQIKQAIIQYLVWLVPKVTWTLVHLVHKLNHTGDTRVRSAVTILAILIPEIPVRLDTFH